MYFSLVNGDGIRYIVYNCFVDKTLSMTSFVEGRETELWNISKFQT